MQDPIYDIENRFLSNFQTHQLLEEPPISNIDHDILLVFYIKLLTYLFISQPKLLFANQDPKMPTCHRHLSKEYTEWIQMVVLGETVQDHLSFKPHIDNLISRCVQTFALKVLKSHGLGDNALWDVTQATLINRLLYALPVWWGFMDASDKQRLQSVIKSC